MELAILRRETTGSGATSANDMETICKFELMDGSPVKGEIIPLRLYLSTVEKLTPTHVSVNNCFSVRYFFNLVLVDEEERRYFKQHEVFFWRNVIA